MKITEILIAMTCMTCLCVHAQEAKPPRVSPADAKSHVGEMVTVCGKVTDTEINKYGVGDYGKPVRFYLDQPKATAQFNFATFGDKEKGEKAPDEAIAAYKDKNVCVTGKVTVAAGKAYIMAQDRSKQIKIQSDEKEKK